MIPCFWTTFPLPSSVWVLVVFLLYLLTSFIAIIGNGLIILLWVRYVKLILFLFSILKFKFRFRILRTPSNLLIISLSISGMMMMITFPMFLVNLFHKGPYLGVTGAKVS